MTTIRMCQVCGASPAHYTHPDGTGICVGCLRDATDRGDRDAVGQPWTIIPPENDELLGTSPTYAVLAERDHGRLFHAVLDGQPKALCGAQPGRQSAGWSRAVGTAVTCARCRRKVNATIGGAS